MATRYSPNPTDPNKRSFQGIDKVIVWNESFHKVLKRGMQRLSTKERI